MPHVKPSSDARRWRAEVAPISTETRTGRFSASVRQRSASVRQRPESVRRRAARSPGVLHEFHQENRAATRPSHRRREPGKIRPVKDLDPLASAAAEYAGKGRK